MRTHLIPAIILMLLPAFAHAGRPDPLPVQDFFTNPKVSAAKISSDGKYLAMAVANDKTGADRNILAIIRTDNHKLESSFWLKDQQQVLQFWWANDERVLLATMTKTGSFDSPRPDGGLYAVNVDGSRRIKLLPNRATSGHVQQPIVYFWYLLYLSPDDTKHVLVAAAPHGYDQIPQAWKVNIYTGDVRKVGQGPAVSGDLVADQQGEVRLATGTTAASGKAKLFYRVNSDTVDWKDLSKLYAGGDSAWAEQEPLGFTPDNKSFYWEGRSQTGTLGLYTVNPDTLKKAKLIALPNLDVAEPIYSFEREKPWKIIAALIEPGYPKIDILDPDDIKAQYLVNLEQAFPNQLVWITSSTRDHSKMVVFVTSDRNPGDFYLFDTKTNKVSYLFSRRPRIKPQQMASMQPIEYKTRDGVTIHGYLTLPPGSSGKHLPLILNPHGGPHGIRDYWEFNPEVQFLANRGYAVLQVNYRGSGGYGLKFQNVGYRHWGTIMQDDLADAVRWAEKQGIADPKRVCIYGGSYGGYAALENVVRYPDLYQCAVGYAGVYDLTLMAGHGDTHHIAAGRNYIDVVLGHDDNYLKKYSPAYNVDKIKVPLFIVYGGADERVVPKNAEELMDALDKAGKPYEKMYEPNEGHGFRKPEHRFEFYKKMAAFFDKYIGPDAKVATN